MMRAGWLPRWLPLWPLVLLVASSVVMVAGNGTASFGVVRWAVAAAGVVAGLVTTARAAFQRGVPRRERRPWLFLIGNWVLQLVAVAGFAAALSGPPDQPPRQGPLLVGALAWALQSVPTLLSLLSFPTRPMSGPERVRFGLDMATVCGGGFISLWYLVLAPALEKDSAGQTRMITITQPAVHAVLIFAVCAIMLRGGVTSVRHPLTFVLAGQVAIIGGVIALAYELVRHNAEVNSVAMDLLTLTGTYLLVMGAILQTRGFGRDARARRVAVRSRRPAVLPYLALGLGYGVLAAQALESADVWVGLIAGALVMTGAVAGRQVFALRENHNFVVRDALTGLSSRVAVYDHLNRAIERGRGTAVLLIDLNGFKPVNDRLGHAAGDELLAAFGAVLRACVRSGDTAGRLGGDEFAVILPDVTDVAAARKVAEAIVARCRTPFTAAGEQVVVGASIGVSITDPDGPVPAQELLRRADAAMYTIKRQRGQRHVLVYDLAMDIDPDSVTEPVPMPGLAGAELAELDRLRSRMAELERKGHGVPAAAR